MTRTTYILAAVALTLLLAAPAFAQVKTGNAAPDVDPENVLLMQLKYGTVAIQLRPDLAPNTVARMKELTRKHFFDGCAFFRVIKDLLEQTGDPTGTGEGGTGKTLKAEFSSEHHVRGTVSMARTDELDSADSQFFIALRPMPDLDHKYTIWGKVIRGMPFVSRIKPGIEIADGMDIENPDRIITMRVEADVEKAGPAAKANP